MKFNALFTALVCVMLCGCSHNISMFATGKVFTLNETGLHYVNGNVVYEVARENSEMEAEFTDADGLGNMTGTSQVSKGMRVRRIIGKQLTGYGVDMAKVSPEAVIAYLTSSGLPELDPMPSPGMTTAAGTSGALKTDADKPATTGNKIEDTIKELGEQQEGCIGDDCAVAGETVETLPMWKVSPEDAKYTAFARNELLLILYGRSTCANCKAVFHALQAEKFADFCKANGIVPTYYLQDATGNDYRFPMDYPEINTPEFILCRPMKGTGNSFTPGVDIEVIQLIPASLTDTEAKLEAAIIEALK